MRTIHTLALSSIAALTLSCGDPEQRVLTTFMDASKAGDEAALSTVSVVEFPGEVSTWEIVSIGPESSTPFPLAEMQEERFEVKQQLDAMVEENDAFLRENEEIYLEYKPLKDEDPDREFTGSMKEFDEEWTKRLDEQKALDERFNELGEEIDALKKEAALSTATPGLGSSFEGDVKKKEAKLRVGDKDYTVTLHQYALINTEHNIEPMARWIVADVSDPS